ncbi:ribosome-associated translation inhibitor RaiA [Candidatus Saccharibacteria bacterium]|nr:ribosome-associated translation inhibitor RaiA [Candidatus Saccharibacteria bacterium]
MIKSIEITGIKYDLDETTKQYVKKKIGRLDRYLPRHARKSVTAEVKLKQVNRDHGNKYEAEIVLSVPDKILTATDSTGNMLAAVDIVESKIVSQLRKYKQSTIAHVGRRGVMSRFKRSYAREL